MLCLRMTVRFGPGADIGQISVSIEIARHCIANRNPEAAAKTQLFFIGAHGPVRLIVNN